jgi:hypothetical protein
MNEAAICLLTDAKGNIINPELFMGIGRLTVVRDVSTAAGVLSEADIIVLQAEDEQWLKGAIKAVRAQPASFLKPLLVLSECLPDGVNGLADEVVAPPASRGAVGAMIARLLPVARKAAALSSPLDTDSLKEVLILQFLYIRDNRPLKPVRDISSRIGYSYPLVQVLLNTSPGDEIGLLDELVESFLLKGELADRVNLCPYCRHFQINFREVCPNCSSLKIYEESTIHHYRCAYVGKEKEFADGAGLRCPKCRKEVRHIGVDYDRPSADLWCDDCRDNFAELALVCYCLSCGRAFAPDDAYVRSIHIFTLTSAGERAAREGVLLASGPGDIIHQEVGIYRPEIFRELLRQEALRCRRYRYPAIFVRCRLQVAGGKWALFLPGKWNRTLWLFCAAHSEVLT